MSSTRVSGVKDIFLLILYSAPPYLTLTLPMAFLLSVIVVLGRLSTENEILVLKASGVNLKRLFVPITLLAVFIAFCGFCNANYIMPKSSVLFRAALFNVAKKSVSMDDKEGVFNDTIPGIVIYIDKVDTQNKTLSGIVISDDRDITLKQTISARTGYININPDTLELYFTLENGNLQRWEKLSDTYRNVNFNNYTFSMNLAMMVPNIGELRRPPYELTPTELKYYLAHLPSDKARYDVMLDIYKIKYAIPLSPLAFILLTVPLGIKRRVEGKFFRHTLQPPDLYILLCSAGPLREPWQSDQSSRSCNHASRKFRYSGPGVLSHKEPQRRRIHDITTKITLNMGILP